VHFLTSKFRKKCYLARGTAPPHTYPTPSKEGDTRTQSLPAPLNPPSLFGQSALCVLLFTLYSV